MTMSPTSKWPDYSHKNQRIPPRIQRNTMSPTTKWTILRSGHCFERARSFGVPLTMPLQTLSWHIYCHCKYWMKLVCDSVREYGPDVITENARDERIVDLLLLRDVWRGTHLVPGGRRCSAWDSPYRWAPWSLTKMNPWRLLCNCRAELAAWMR